LGFLVGALGMIIRPIRERPMLDHRANFPDRIRTRQFSKAVLDQFGGT
jgi:hypothetical protein